MRHHLALALAALALSACNGTLAGGLYGGQAKPPPPAPPPPTVIESKYSPETAIQPGTRSTVSAVRIYRGDVKLLPPEARVIGTYQVRLNVDASDSDVQRELQHLSADRGGSHYVVAYDTVNETETRERNRGAEVFRAFAQGMAEADCTNPDGTTKARRSCWEPQSNAPIYKVRTSRERVVALVVMAVEPEQWTDLPAPLRPHPIKGATPKGNARAADEPAP